MATKTLFMINNHKVINQNYNIKNNYRTLNQQRTNHKYQKMQMLNSLKQNSGINFLEVSTASQYLYGRKASALNLKLTYQGESATVENWYQAGKYFANNGNNPELLHQSPFKIKGTIHRLHQIDTLTKFKIKDTIIDIEPKDLFYNWLYCMALNQHPELVEKLLSYNAFSDINFNSKYGIACQAKACCIYLILYQQNLTNQINDIKTFYQAVYSGDNPIESC